MLRVAREYVAKGWSVFPLIRRDKLPDSQILPQKEVDGRLVWLDANKNETFENTGVPKKTWTPFAHRYATDEELVAWFADGTRNIAIATGALSKLVVVDLDGPEGIANAARLGIDSPVKVTTSRGYHLYFRHGGGVVGNSATKIAPGIDVRGDKGYVVAPPSVHSSGVKYGWAVVDGQIPTFDPGQFSPPPAAPGPSSPGWIGEALSGVGEGNRDVTFTRVVGKLHRDGWGPGDMLALLQPKADDVGFEARDLQRIVRSISSRPRSLPDNEELPSAVLSAFLDTDEKVEWLVPGLIANNTVGFTVGLPETNKTWVMMDLAIEAARGGMWLNKFPTTKSRVLFIDQERFAGETKRRFRALLAGKGVHAAQLDGRLEIWCGTTVRVDLDHSFEAFQRRLGEFSPDLVIVDSFATFHTKEENNRTDIQIVMERIKRLRQQYNCAFMFIDHENKGVFQAEADEAPSAMRMSGSVAKPAAAELVLTVRSKGGGRSAVYPTKSTLGPAAEPFIVEVKDVTEDKSKITVQAVE